MMKNRLFFFQHRGFTLIELLVVVVIIGIIASIALPAYQSYIERTELSDAKTKILSIKQSFEARKLKSPKDFNTKSKIETDLDGLITAENKIDKKFTFSYVVDNDDKSKSKIFDLYFQTVPKVSTRQYFLWVDANSQAFKCKKSGSTPAITPPKTKPSDCEAF